MRGGIFCIPFFIKDMLYIGKVISTLYDAKILFHSIFSNILELKQLGRVLLKDRI